MLILESTKNKHHTPTGPCPYFDIFTPHIHTQPWQRHSQGQAKMTHKHIHTKVNTDKFETMQNQCYSPIKKKQCKLGVWFQAFQEIYLGPLPDHNPMLFLRYFPLFYLSLSIVGLIISVLCTQIECSLIYIITRHIPYCWLATSVFWDSVRHCSQKHFSNIA